MNQNIQPQEDLRVIKKMMEESSRFLSLSGFSGVLAGIFAIAGGLTAWRIMPAEIFTNSGYAVAMMEDPDGRRVLSLLFADAAAMLVLALSGAAIFSYRKAKRDGHLIWTAVTRRVLLNMFIPLIAGGLFILLTLGTVPGSVTASATLLFYGLALVNTAKFTLGEIFWLGLTEIGTGLLCLVIPEGSLWLWIFGFGVMHIIYGLYMHVRYR